MRLVPNLAVLVGVLMLSVACAAPQTAVQPTSPEISPNRFGAPQVPQRLNVDVVAAAPCQTLLSASEAVQLDAAQASEKEFLGARGCMWTVRGTQKLSIVVYAERDYFVDTYRTRTDPVFVPSTVEGFPAVRQKTGRGQLNICTVTTGVSDHAALDAVWVSAGRPARGQRCVRVRRAGHGPRDPEAPAPALTYPHTVSD